MYVENLKTSPPPVAQIESVSREPLTTRLIQRLVATHYGISLEHLLSERRMRKYARPRQIAMWLAIKLVPGHSFPRVGRAFERDHTTVMHSVKIIEDLRRREPKLRNELEHFETRILDQTIIPTQAEICAARIAEDVSEAFRRALFALAARDPEELIRRAACLAL